MTTREEVQEMFDGFFGKEEGAKAMTIADAQPHYCVQILTFKGEIRQHGVIFCERCEAVAKSHHILVQAGKGEYPYSDVEGVKVVEV